MRPQTLYDKLWDEHVVQTEPDGSVLLYIDRHFVHEVTSPQAFEGLRMAGRGLWRAKSIVATADHNTPTSDWALGYGAISDSVSREQIVTLDQNIQGIPVKAYYPFLDQRQGIVHVIGPETGATLPGMTVVCGDSHTSTHGALGALAFGIGSSEVEHVLATQTLVAQKAKNMLVRIEGVLSPGICSKDVALHLIGMIGTAGATGHAIEFAGSTVDDMTMEARMTLCNMAIEAGARSGLVAVDETTLAYVRGKQFAPHGQSWDQAVSRWRSLHSDPGAAFDHVVSIDASQITPMVTWGTSPDLVLSIDGHVPDPEEEPCPTRRATIVRALSYMALKAHQPIKGLSIDQVFIGSCTNSRMDDLRAAAAVVQQVGGRIASNVQRALVVPGSGQVKRAAEQEGLHEIFLAAGFEWREPGCSMCLGMNADTLSPGQRCASTSNRNFEGRQGAGGRTHLVGPAMAALAAMTGRFSDLRELALMGSPGSQTVDEHASL